MDPTSNKGKLNQDDSPGSMAPSPSNTTSTTAVATTAHIADGMLQVPEVDMPTPPVPDAQIIAALEEEIVDEDAARKKPRGKPEVIEDEGPPPLPAMAAATNNEDAAMNMKMKGTAKGPELIEDDGDAPTDYAALFHDEGGDHANKKPAAAKGAVTPLQPQVQPAMLAPPVPDAQIFVALEEEISDEGNKKKPDAAKRAVTQPQPQSQLRPHTVVPPSRPNQDGDNTLGTSLHDHVVHDQASTRPQVRPTPQSMLPRPIIAGAIQAPSVPVFHEVEARLVEEEPPAPVYLATIVPDNPDIEEGKSNSDVGTSQTETEEEVPWWKRYQRYIFGTLVFCVVAIVMGILLGPQGSNAEGTTKSRNNEPLTPPTTCSIRSPSLNSTNAPPQTKIIPNDGRASDAFGYSVSMSGDTVVVSSRDDDDNGSSSGSAYVFIRDGDAWKQQAKLLPNDGQSGDVFGFTVSVSGDTVVVGAHDNDDNGDNSGSAYVFIRDGDNWNQQAKLLPNDGHAGAKFGISVSVSGETVIVGAERDDNENGRSSGSAYVFIRDRDSWKQHAKLLANDGQEYSQFGHAVSVSEDTVVVGDYGHDGNGDNSGSAYVFIRDSDTWKQQAKLSPNDGQVGDEFGLSVSVSGDTVVVGAVRDDNENGNDSGSAYVFIRDGDTWKQHAKLLSNDGKSNELFGSSVPVSGDTVVVAAIADNNENGSASGSVYVFIRDIDTWKQQSKLLSNDGQAGDRFGRWVAVSGDTMVVGADKANNDHGCKSGSAYVFEVISPTNLQGQ